MLKRIKETAWIFTIRLFQENWSMLKFHEFSRTHRSTKTEKLTQLHKYTSNYNLFQGQFKFMKRHILVTSFQNN